VWPLLLLALAAAALAPCPCCSCCCCCCFHRRRRCSWGVGHEIQGEGTAGRGQAGGVRVAREAAPTPAPCVVPDHLI